MPYHHYPIYKGQYFIILRHAVGAYQLGLGCTKLPTTAPYTARCTMIPWAYKMVGLMWVASIGVSSSSRTHTCHIPRHTQRGLVTIWKSPLPSIPPLLKPV